MRQNDDLDPEKKFATAQEILEDLIQRSDFVDAINDWAYTRLNVATRQATDRADQALVERLIALLLQSAKHCDGLTRNEDKEGL